jgi:ATP-dependent Clp protease ATP-binding subunit ClpA
MVTDDGRPVPTPRYTRVLDHAAAIAGDMGHGYLGVEHLFLAIVRDRMAVPTQVLAGLADLDNVDARLCEEMRSPGYRGEPP